MSDAPRAPTMAKTDSVMLAERDTTDTKTDADLAASMSAVRLDASQIKAMDTLFQELCSSHPVSVGKALSSQERDAKSLESSTLVYGEIKFDSYAIAFEKIKNLYGGLATSGGVFYDIGSGTGKPVFAACLLHDWTRAVGVEVLEGLYTASLELLERWNTKMKAKLPPAKQRIAVEFIRGDATELDWSDADMIFMNSTCFDEALMAKFATIADKTKVGTFCVTFTKRLPSPKWEVLEHNVYTMSWGNATVYIQKKTSL